MRALLLSTTLVAGALLVAPAPPARAQSLIGDENGPKVQIIAPAYQDVLKGKTRILIGIVAGQYNPSTIEFWIDDRPTGSPIPLSSMASMSFDWDTRRFKDGPHKLTIRATDTQGFRGQKEVNVYINNQNKRETGTPDLKWKNVAPFQQLSGQTQLELETKNSFGVKWIIVKVAPADKGNTGATRSWMLGGGQTKFKFDTTKVADGIYTVSAKAWDALDQEGNAPGLTIGVVNSSINATTVGESLDGLRQMEQVEKSKLAGTSAASPSALSPLNGSRAQKPPVVSAKVAPSTKATVRSLPPAPLASVGGKQLEPLFVPQPGAVSTKKTAPGNKTRIARSGQGGSPVQTPAALSKPKADVLPAARTEAEQETANGKTFAARVSTPDAPTRTEPASAQLSAPADASTKSALSLPQSDTVETPAQSRIEIARLALPSDEAHAVEIAPVLSATRGFESVASSGSEVVASSTDRVAAALVASAPDVEKTTPRHAKVVVSNHGDNLRIVERPETPRLSTELALPAPAEVAPIASPQLNAPQSADTAVAKGKTFTSRLAKIAPRIAALPSRKNPITKDAIGTDERPAITVSPIQAVFNSALPKQHLVKTETTLRALADHYGLPVEMVAAANNWNANMRVIPGMVVLLPQQVQLSYNGQKVGGNVSSLLIGDTTVTALRFLFEQNGGKLEWNAQKQEVIARKGTSTIHIKIGSKVATVDNKQVMMQLAAFLFEGRTMVPARFFEEGLNAQVEWDPTSGHLVVAMAN